MIINEKKDKRQELSITRWLAFKAISVIIAVTGFGKTRLAIKAILRMNIKQPNFTTYVIVPSLKLKEDWIGNNTEEGHIKEWNLKNVTVHVVNSYTNIGNDVDYPVYHCNLLVCDEVHNYCNPEAKLFSKVIGITKYDYFMGLSATLGQKEKDFLLSHGIPLADEIGLEEAKREGYISQFLTFNLGIELSPKDEIEYRRFHDIFNAKFAKFDHDFDRALAISTGNKTKLSEWHELTGWNKSEIQKDAQLWAWAMRERKKFLYKTESKLLITKELIETFEVPTLTFAEDCAFADKLEKLVGSDVGRAYHTKLTTKIIDGKKVGKDKLKKQIIEDFKEGKIRAVFTAKALDEGADFPEVSMGVICSATSKQLQNIQRSGRILRFKEGKVALIINLYIKDSQDLRWLKDRQKGLKDIKWVNSINEIKQWTEIKI